MTPTPIAQLVTFAQDMQANITSIFIIIFGIVNSILVLFVGFTIIKRKIIHNKKGKWNDFWMTEKEYDADIKAHSK